MKSSDIRIISDRLYPLANDLIRDHGAEHVIATLVLSAADLCHRCSGLDLEHLAAMFLYAAAGQGDPSDPVPDAEDALDRYNRAVHEAIHGA